GEAAPQPLGEEGEDLGCVVVAAVQRGEQLVDLATVPAQRHLGGALVVARIHEAPDLGLEHLPGGYVHGAQIWAFCAPSARACAGGPAASHRRSSATTLGVASARSGRDHAAAAGAVARRAARRRTKGRSNAREKA